MHKVFGASTHEHDIRVCTNIIEKPLTANHFPHCFQAITNSLVSLKTCRNSRRRKEKCGLTLTKVWRRPVPPATSRRRSSETGLPHEATYCQEHMKALISNYTKCHVVHMQRISYLRYRDRESPTSDIGTRDARCIAS
jgi:hypothetical protein